jgi:hypothetical protein
MQKNTTIRLALMFAFISISVMASAQIPSSPKTKETAMKTYLIERDIPGASQLTMPELKGISQKSCTVIREIGPGIKWINSYVAGNKIYCVYQADNEKLLRDHAQKGGFPITTIAEVSSIISPATADQ